GARSIVAPRCACSTYALTLALICTLDMNCLELIDDCNAARPGFRRDWSYGPADDPPPARCGLPADPVEPHPGQVRTASGTGRASCGEPRRVVPRCQRGDALPGQYRG